MARYSTEDGAFEIDSIPGQVQVAMCHGFFVKNEKRGQRKAHELKAHQNTVLKMLGYNFAVCTVASDNKAQRRVLEKANWFRIAAFSNSRLGGNTEMYGYEVSNN